MSIFSNPYVDKKYFLYRIDDDFKLLISHSPEDVIIKCHQHFYPSDVYDKELTPLGSFCGNFPMKDIINENGFLEETEIEVSDFLSNFHRLMKAEEYFQAFQKVPKKPDPGLNKTSQKPMHFTDLTDLKLGENKRISQQDELGFDGILEQNSMNDCPISLAPKYSFEKDSFLANDFSEGRYYNLSGNLLPDVVKPFSDFNYIFYYNKQFKKAILLQEAKTDPCMFPEFVEALEINSKKLSQTMEDVNQDLQRQVFLSLEDCKKYLEDRYLNLNQQITGEDIKKHIQKQYILTDELGDRIKFTNLYHDLKTQMNLNEENATVLKRCLPYILYELQLQKKRYNDGMYWFGLKEQTESLKYNSADESTEKVVDAYEKMQEERYGESVPKVPTPKQLFEMDIIYDEAIKTWDIRGHPNDYNPNSISESISTSTTTPTTTPTSTSTSTSTPTSTPTSTSTSTSTSTPTPKSTLQDVKNMINEK